MTDCVLLKICSKRFTRLAQRVGREVANELQLLSKKIVRASLGRLILRVDPRFSYIRNIDEIGTVPALSVGTEGSYNLRIGY
jgi:hypothetical protein